MKTVLDYLDKRIAEIQAKLTYLEENAIEPRQQGKDMSIRDMLGDQALGALIELKRARDEILAGNVEGFEP